MTSGKLCTLPCQRHQHQPHDQAGTCSSAGHQSGVWGVCSSWSSLPGLGFTKTLQTKLKVQGKYPLTPVTSPELRTPKGPRWQDLEPPLLLPTTQECELAANKSLIQIRKRAALSAGECVPQGMFGVLGSRTGPFKPTTLPRLQLLTLNQSCAIPSPHTLPQTQNAAAAKATVSSGLLGGTGPCASISKPVNRALSKQELWGVSTGPRALRGLLPRCWERALLDRCRDLGMRHRTGLPPTPPTDPEWGTCPATEGHTEALGYEC